MTLTTTYNTVIDTSDDSWNGMTTYHLESYLSELDDEPIVTIVYQNADIVVLISENGTQFAMERCPRVMLSVSKLENKLKRLMTRDSVSQDAAILEILVSNGLYRQEINVSVK